jgi:hypothetical protein
LVFEERPSLAEPLKQGRKTPLPFCKMLMAVLVK